MVARREQRGGVLAHDDDLGLAVPVDVADGGGRAVGEAGGGVLPDEGPGVAARDREVARRVEEVGEQVEDARGHAILVEVGDDGLREAALARSVG
ncbi:MAG: hypothetical protein ACK559_24165, partial [bacterium]